MGKFIYDSDIRVDFEDRLLSHLQTVIMSKVRRGESFSFSWKEDQSVGGGRTTVYIHPHVAMVFKFHGSRQPQLNGAWLQALSYNANSPRGLYVVPEPDDHALRDTTHQTVMTFKEVAREDVPTGPLV